MERSHELFLVYDRQGVVECHHDLVRVDDRQEVLDVSREYPLPESEARKVRACGHLRAPEMARDPERIYPQPTSGPRAGTQPVVAIARGSARPVHHKVSLVGTLA